MLVLVMIVIIVVGSVLAPRMNELFALSIRDGRVLVIRGGVPAGLLAAISDVVRDARVRRGTLRAVRGPDHARLIVSGADEGTAQRLRNVFGIHPIHELRAAPAAANRNIGQLVGWAWLSWLLLSR